MTTVTGYDSRVVVVLSSSNYSQAATLQIRMIPTNQQKMYEDNKLNSFSRGSEHFLFCPEYPTDYDTIRQPAGHAACIAGFECSLRLCRSRHSSLEAALRLWH